MNTREKLARQLAVAEARTWCESRGLEHACKSYFVMYPSDKLLCLPCTVSRGIAPDEVVKGYCEECPFSEEQTCWCDDCGHVVYSPDGAVIG